MATTKKPPKPKNNVILVYFKTTTEDIPKLHGVYVSGVKFKEQLEVMKKTFGEIWIRRVLANTVYYNLHEWNEEECKRA